MTKYENRLSRDIKLRFLIAGLILVIVGIFVILPDYKELTEKQANLSALQTQIDSLESELNQERDEYRALKSDYVVRAATDKEAIEISLPETPSQTEIVRRIESYINQISDNLGGNIVLDKIDFSKSKQEKDKDFAILPFKMTMSTTKEKLNTFLKYLEHSGKINVDDDQASPLLDLQDVNIQKRDFVDNTQSQNNINADFSINAYFLPSAETSAKTK